MIARRNFCVAFAGLVAAPYVIRNSGVLMPVRQMIASNRFVVLQPWQVQFCREHGMMYRDYARMLRDIQHHLMHGNYDNKMGLSLLS